jgi:methyl-accepting chemotaxis protein
MKRRSTLERQMLTYFGLIAAASLLISIEFVWALRMPMAEARNLMQTGSMSGASKQNIMKALLELQNKAILVGIVQALVTLIVFVMFTRKITTPLQQMIDESRLICDGDRSRTILVLRQDEIGLLGETINGLTSNIQEIVAFGLSMDSAVRPALQDLRARMGDNSACRERFDQIDERLSEFRSLIERFTLLPAPSAAKEPDKNK